MVNDHKPALEDIVEHCKKNIDDNINKNFHHYMQLLWIIGVLTHEFGYYGSTATANKYLDDEINSSPIYDGLKDDREELIKQIKMVLEMSREAPNATYIDKNGKEHLCYAKPVESYIITVENKNGK